MTEIIFKEDEAQLLRVSPGWSPAELLKQEGVFYLKDVVKLLPVDMHKIKRHAKLFHDRGDDPWEKMGVRKVLGNWMVKMNVFAGYYRKALEPKLTPIEDRWDANQLLAQKGVFALTEVCKHIPFTASQLRHQAKKNPKAKREYGIWKDKDLKIFVVDMSVFGPWLGSLWRREPDEGLAENRRKSR